MSEKKASVHWEGAGKSGQGQISTETGALDKYPYGFASRFGDDRKGEIFARIQQGAILSDGDLSRKIRSVMTSYKFGGMVADSLFLVRNFQP